MITKKGIGEVDVIDYDPQNLTVTYLIEGNEIERSDKLEEFKCDIGLTEIKEAAQERRWGEDELEFVSRYTMQWLNRRILGSEFYVFTVIWQKDGRLGVETGVTLGEQGGMSIITEKLPMTVRSLLSAIGRNLINIWETMETHHSFELTDALLEEYNNMVLGIYETLGKV